MARTPRFDRRAATAHLLALADEHGIVVSWVRSWGKAEAWPMQPAVSVPRIRTARDYLIGLHELGHCLSRESRDLHIWTSLYDEVACEGFAWAWAVTHADPDIARTISAREWSLAGSAFTTYLRYAARWEAEEPRYLPSEAGTPGPATVEV